MDALERVAMVDCRPALAKAGVVVDQLLGCGVFGCVIYTGRFRVIKVVAKGNEAEIRGSVWIGRLGARRPAELPEIFRVFRLKDCVKPDLREYGVHVIEREQLNDVKASGRAERTFDNETRWLEQIGWEIPGHDFPAFRQAVKSWEESVAPRFGEPGVAWTTAWKCLRAAVRLQLWAYEMGVEIRDNKLENWGQRADGSFAMRDFGRIAPLEGFEDTHPMLAIPDLDTLGRCR